MLFKRITQFYGAYLAGGKPAAQDIVGRVAPEAECRAFRRGVIEDIAAATIYVLDAEAADYADSIRETLMEHSFTMEGALKVSAELEKVVLPHELTWVEYDQSRLTVDRVRRGHSDPKGAAPHHFGAFGFLVDDRPSDHTRIVLFREGPESGAREFIDPLHYFQFRKDDTGRREMSGLVQQFHDHMVAFYQSYYSESEMDRQIERELKQASYEFVLPFMLFALIASGEEDIVPTRRDTLSRSEIKTATKFGKTWITDVPRTHVTIRIGEKGRRHLREHSERKAHARARVEGRLPPTEHWVSEHERHYKDGRVVLIRAHKRGQPADASVPRMVKGPRTGAP